MKIKTSGARLIVFADTYFRHFDDYLLALSKGEEQKETTREFFTKQNLDISSALFEHLAELTDLPLVLLGQAVQKVINHSFWSGDFAMDDFEDGISTYQKELLMAVGKMRVFKGGGDIKHPLYKQANDQMEGFFKEGYRNTDLSEIRRVFLTPVRTGFGAFADTIKKQEKVVSLDSYRKQR